MATFRPQRVPASSVWLWLREAFALCRRQPLWFLGIGAAWSAVSLLPLPFSLLMLLGLGLPLAAGCVVAHAADSSRSPMDMLRSVSASTWRDLLIAGALPWLAVGGLILAVSVLTQPLELMAGVDNGPLFTLPEFLRGQWQPLRDLSLALVTWLVAVGIVGWFVVPLMTLAGLPLLQAYGQAIQAISMNGFVVGLVFAIAVICAPVFMLLSPLFAVPLLAMLSSLMYVSFRHIWLGQGRNTPEVAKATVRVLQPAAIPSR
ncbi:MAG TPA: hypothetical protein VKZ99_08135 [Gammaproteobacteria bacterium]|nr:hypothetical protein [Gammaproteobacteria bacterium]